MDIHVHVVIGEEVHVHVYIYIYTEHKAEVLNTTYKDYLLKNLALAIKMLKFLLYSIWNNN